MSDYVCIQSINIFKGLEKKEEEEIVSLFKEEKYNKGETIFTPYEEFENIYMIYKGKVSLYQMSAEGKKIVIDVLKTGDIFLNFSLFFDPDVKVTDFAEAVEETNLCIMNKDDFLSVILNHPKVAFNIIKDLSQKLNEADSRIRDLALSNTTIRAINELLRLSKKDGASLDGRVKISTRLTHEDFADMIGTSRETATKILKKLQSLSFIDYTKDKHIIVNTDKIKEPL